MSSTALTGTSHSPSLLLSQSISHTPPCSNSPLSPIFYGLPREEGDPEDEDEKADFQQCIFALNHQSQGTPVFFLHDMLGNAKQYVTLASKVNSPFYGIEPTRYAPLESLEDLARHYVRHIRRLQPHGPYALGGFSLGGLICLEIALQLEAVGETVEKVIIVDLIPDARRCHKMDKAMEAEENGGCERDEPHIVEELLHRNIEAACQALGIAHDSEMCNRIQFIIEKVFFFP